MARSQLLLTPTPVSISGAGLAAIITLLLCAFALFMCASHSRKWRRWVACSSSYGHDPVIQHNNEAIMQGAGIHGYPPDDTSEVLFSGDQQRLPVWQKNILMGGKCQLPDFSGVILYNSEGNIVTPAKPPCPRLTWK